MNLLRSEKAGQGKGKPSRQGTSWAGKRLVLGREKANLLGWESNKPSGKNPSSERLGAVFKWVIITAYSG